jgi:hypothetical protein
MRICSPPAQLRSYGITPCQLFVTIQMYSRVTSISAGRLLSSIHNLRMRHAKVTRACVTMTVLTVRESFGQNKVMWGIKVHTPVRHQVYVSGQLQALVF